MAGMTPRTSLGGSPTASLVLHHRRRRRTRQGPTRKPILGDKHIDDESVGQSSSSFAREPVLEPSKGSLRNEKSAKTEDSAKTDSGLTKDGSEGSLDSALTEDYDGDSSRDESDDDEGMGWGAKPVSEDLPLFSTV